MISLVPIGLATACVGGSFESSVSPNPSCDISAVVTWETVKPASSWVEFGEGSTLTHRIGSDELTTEHEVVVVGMHADATYTLQPVSETESGYALETDAHTYETGSLPGTWLDGTVDVYDEAASVGGWTLANVAQDTFSDIIIVMLDMEGRTVWYFIHDGGQGRADIEATLDGESILIGPGMPVGVSSLAVNLQGETVWEGPTQPGTTSADLLRDGALHHVLHRTPAGTYVTVAIDERDGILGDEIMELDEDLGVVWSWSPFDHLEVDSDDVGPFGDWSYFNSIVFSEGNEAAYVNSWNLNQVFKIDHETSELVWTFGMGGDFSADPDASEPWFESAHGLKYLDNGHLLIYDNGSAARGYSRAIEYEIDEENMTSTVVWEYPGSIADDAWHNLYWGDVDRLENDNTSLTAGNTPRNFDPSRIIEVTPEGELVWQMWWEGGDSTVGAYASERIEALAQPIDSP